MTYLYAGLGIAMLLPIMAGLQFAIALAELESGNDAIVSTQQMNERAATQREMEYLQSESEEFSKALKPSGPADKPFACDSTPGAIESLGYRIDPVAYGSACSFISVVPAPLPGGGKVRIYVELTVAGTGTADVVDACMLSNDSDRCVLEQERQPPPGKGSSA